MGRGGVRGGGCEVRGCGAGVYVCVRQGGVHRRGCGAEGCVTIGDAISMGHRMVCGGMCFPDLCAHSKAQGYSLAGLAWAGALSIAQGAGPGTRGQREVTRIDAATDASETLSPALFQVPLLLPSHHPCCPPSCLSSEVELHPEESTCESSSSSWTMAQCKAMTWHMSGWQQEEIEQCPPPLLLVLLVAWSVQGSQPHW